MTYVTPWDIWAGTLAYFPGDDTYIIRHECTLKVVKRCADGTC